ncbi:hypothetical protein ACH4UM_04095 [Streptomyces sp. NPDC020801]|uniref:hypothetical protein n=1 Tax=unclassified Streptomyces TaxID=2593676 RepID=UPI0037A8491D
MCPLHTRPDRGSRALRIARPGEVVWIHCRTVGRDVRGDRLWNLLAGRTWAWAPARFVHTLGFPPRWC